jgi:hypothetical protein
MSEFLLGPSFDDPNVVFGKKLSALVDVEDEMDEYENEFLGNMVDRFEKGFNFTDNQIEFVNKLCEKYL